MTNERGQRLAPGARIPLLSERRWRMPAPLPAPERLEVTFRCTDTTPDHYRRNEGETMSLSLDGMGLWMVPGVGQWGHLGGIPGRMGPGLEWLMDEIPESALHPVEQALRKVDRLLADGPDPVRHLEAQHELLKAQAAMTRQQWAGGR